VANLKEIKRRIGSVKKTKQITSAMKLVSGAKMSRAVQAATAAQPYQRHLAAVLGRVGQAAGEQVSNPLLRPKAEVKRILVAVITTDRGLCAGFNNILLKRTVAWMADQRARGATVDVVTFGRKGRDYLRNRKVEILDATLNYARIPKMDLVQSISSRGESGFVDGTYDEVWLASNRFVNTITQTPAFQKVLPLQMDAGSHASASAAGDLVEFEYEPGAEELLNALLPLYLRTLILQAFLETEAGEHAARMTAMDNATRNASDLINALTLEYNRARQAAITKEIIEIVSGAEALNG
jgi:F-type H+-transporting ATPase subunit gamma